MYFGSKNHNITPEQDVGIQKLFFCWKALFNTKPLVYVEFLYLVNFGFSLVFYGFSQFFLNFCHFSKSCAIPQPLVKSKIQADGYIQNVITHLWGQKSKFRQKLLRPPKLIFQMTSLLIVCSMLGDQMSALGAQMAALDAQRAALGAQMAAQDAQNNEMRKD